MRKLLLGDEFASSGDEAKPASSSKDDFFMDDDTKNGSDDNDGEEPQNMTFSFVPDVKKELEAKKTKKRADAGLVCDDFYVFARFLPFNVGNCRRGPRAAQAKQKREIDQTSWRQ
jgi:hypothetical protein